jgi:hypothetical protein
MWNLASALVGNAGSDILGMCARDKQNVRAREIDCMSCLCVRCVCASVPVCTQDMGEIKASQTQMRQELLQVQVILCE